MRLRTQIPRVVQTAALLLAAACAATDSVGAGASVAVRSVQLTGCPKSASPLPGWLNCTGTVTLDVTRPPSSNYLSVFFDYGSSGSFYHGQTAVNAAGSYTINVVNEYVQACLTSVATTVDVYDGQQTASSPPLVTSSTLTLTGTC